MQTIYMYFFLVVSFKLSVAVHFGLFFFSCYFFFPPVNIMHENLATGCEGDCL